MYSLLVYMWDYFNNECTNSRKGNTFGIPVLLIEYKIYKIKWAVYTVEFCD